MTSRCRLPLHPALLSLATVLLPAAPSAQTASKNVEILSQITRSGEFGYAGVIGHVQPGTGREFAVVGTRKGTWIVETTDPRKPVEKGFIPAPPSDFWREVNIYKGVVYSITEKYGGMQIIDLANPDAPKLLKTLTLPGWNNSHTVSVDQQQGVLYVNGTSLGALLFDVKTDPRNPKLITRWTTTYVHDAFIQNGLAYFSCRDDQRLWILDVSKLPQMTTLARIVTPRRRTHNAWATSDDRIVVTTDDIGNAPLQLWDMRDRAKPVALGSYTPAGGAIHYAFLTDDKIAHIVQIGGDYRALDISDPNKPTVVARLPGAVAWGAYPYQPSRTIYVTGIPSNGGLYCIRLTCGFPEPYGKGTAGSGGRVPAIDWQGGHARVGNRAFRIEGRDLLGGTAAALLLGAAQTSIQLAGIDLLVDPAKPFIMSVTATSGSGAGAGTARAAVPIPPVPALAGVTLFSQWVVLDGGGPAGLAASRGMRFTICKRS